MMKKKKQVEEHKELINDAVPKIEEIRALPRHSNALLVPRISSSAPLPALHYPYSLLAAEGEVVQEDDDYYIGVMEEMVDPRDDWPHISHARRRQASSTTIKAMQRSEMVALTMCFLGIQFAWTIEMAYGSPFLLELGLSKSLMSLVWIAGPISGLIAQPFFGSMSDRCSLKMGRRRPFIIGGTIATVLSMLAIGHAQDFQKTHEAQFRLTIAIFIAVVGFWLMDFAINVVMASCRALVVDVVPPHQQQAANAFASFLLGCGNITGYFTCNLNMVSLFPFMGTQMKSLCYIASFILFVCITCTCCAVKEVSLTDQSLSET
jgi:hypothetical protein